MKIGGWTASFMVIANTIGTASSRIMGEDVKLLRVLSLRRANGIPVNAVLSAWSSTYILLERPWESLAGLLTLSFGLSIYGLDRLLLRAAASDGSSCATCGRRGSRRSRAPRAGS